MVDITILEELGFTKGEIKVYLALLGLGNTSTGPLILKSKVSRSKVYEILERLKEKGLVTESIRENTKYFQSTSPKRILDYIEQKQQKIENEKSSFQELLPQLLEKEKSVHEKQEARVYVGFEGVKTFYAEALDQLSRADEYLVITQDRLHWEHPAFSTFIKNLNQKRLEKKLRTKVIYNASLVPFKERKDFPDNAYFEMRSLVMELPLGLIIFRDTVAISSWLPTPRVFSIICKDVASQYRRFFYEMWKKAKKL